MEKIYREAKNQIQEQIDRLEKANKILSEYYEFPLPEVFANLRETNFNVVKTYEKVNNFLANAILEELPKEVAGMAEVNGSEVKIKCGRIMVVIPTITKDSIQVYGLREWKDWLGGNREVRHLQRLNDCRYNLKIGNKKKAKSIYYGTESKILQLARGWSDKQFMTSDYLERLYRSQYAKVVELAIKQKKEKETYQKNYKKFKEVILPALNEYADGRIKIVRI